MKKFLFLILGVFLFGATYKYNGKTYEYEVVDTVDIICDKEIKKKSFICCNRRFFSFEDMEKFILTGKLPDYSYMFNVDCRGYKGNVKEFKEALKNGDFEKAEKLLQKEKSLAKYGYEIILQKDDFKKIAELLKPYADAPDEVLIELANRGEFKKLDYFVKDKKAFAKKHMYQFKNSEFMKHYGFKALDFFTKKQIGSMYGYVIERLIQIFDDDYLKGAWCMEHICFIGAYSDKELKKHKNYCRHLPKDSLFYKMIFKKEEAIKDLKLKTAKSQFKINYFKYGSMLINLYLADGQKEKAKKVFFKLLNRCDNLFDRINSEFLVFVLGPWLGKDPFAYSLRDECKDILKRGINENYRWISVFYDYRLDLKDFR